MTTKEAAAYLGISYFYLRNLRKDQHLHDGPRYTFQAHPRGIACHYSRTDLDAWAKQHPWRKRAKKLTDASVVVSLSLR